MRFLPPFWTLLLGLMILAPACKRDRAGELTGEEVFLALDRPLNEAVVQLNAEPDRLNPALSTSAYSRIVMNGVFLYLLAVDPATLEVVPQLARSRAEATPIASGPYQGGMAYAFEIRPEAVWDNGSPVTAQDYIFTLKAVFNPLVPAAAYRAYLSFIKDVEPDPDNPRRFTVLTDQTYIIGEEAIGAAVPVMPAYHYDPEGLLRDIPLTSFTAEAAVGALAEQDARLQQFAKQFDHPVFSREPEGVVGCGPYRLEQWETGQRLVLVKKDNWWGDPLASEHPLLAGYPDKLIYRIISDPNAAIAALKDGQIDAISDLPPNRFDELKQTAFVAERYDFHSPPSLANTFVYMNTRSPKLADKRVRQALAHAIDVEEIINTIFYGYGAPYASPVHPSAKYYHQDLAPIGYDPAQARALLEAAGWKDSNNNGIADKIIDGQLVELNLNYKYTAGREISQNLALLVQESARRAGFNIELEAKEFAVIADDLKRRDFELAPWAKTISPTLWEPKQDFHSEGDNRTGFGNAETDALIDRIQVTLDETERNRLYTQLQAILYEEMPLVYILIPTGRIATQKRFQVVASPVTPGFVPGQLRLRRVQ